MKPTRREFLVTSAIAAGGAVLARPAQSDPVVPHEMFDGDLYRAEHGLGGRSFDEARDNAVRFRNLEI
ncbi:MAG TPA: twin-arginine translocation signal domain-containing protein [Thermoanaerobaculia bacterium]|nr:twin-arginine translocation signal domain-containing protein [Thermoanaerobaculia bacterium]